MGTTEVLARFVVETSFEDMPPEAVRMAKEIGLDCLGVMMAGSVEGMGKIVARHVEALGGVPEAGVVGGGFRTSAPNAALANGVTAHALDYDDAGAHISAPVFPAVLALGEKLDLSGARLLEAFILGFEVFGRLRLGATREHTLRGWHDTSIFGVMGAAAAAAKVLRLNVEQTAMALGIAASSASGLWCNFGTMTKPLHAGNASRDGLTAALLAKDGFTARTDAVEARLGYAQAILGEPEYDLEKMTENVGNPFYIVSPGVCIKKYPCCLGNHRALDAVLQLIQEHRVSYDEVELVEVDEDSFQYNSLFYHEPVTGLQGKFSIEYNMAAAILDGKVTRETFTDDKAHSAKLREALRKVKVNVHPEWSQVAKSAETRGSNPVTVRLRDGKVWTNRVDIPKGFPTNPLSRDEIVAKYRDNARLVLTARDVERSAQLVLTMEEQSSIRHLMDMVTRVRAAA